VLQVVNLTPFVARLVPLPNEQGIDCAYAIVKATYQILPAVAVAAEQVPVVMADQPWGEPAASSLRYASDLTLTKPATDVMMVGTAHAPAGRRVTEMDVALRVGPLSKTVRVFGDRVWRKGLLSAAASSPQPFDRMPLVYERSFGGTDRSHEAEGKMEDEPRNPVGRGFRGKKSSLPVEDTPLPNLEEPRHLIKGLKDAPPPANFGPIAAHWQPRRSYAGTYDEAWQKNRCPYLPADFDLRFCNAAHPDLVAKGYLQGGEPVEVVGASPRGTLHFALPRVQVRVIYTIAGEKVEKTPNLDTVTVEPDENRFTLVWRAQAECDQKVLQVRQIRVECDGPAAPTRGG
jgi:hypothetical protein